MSNNQEKQSSDLPDEAQPPPDKQVPVRTSYALQRLVAALTPVAHLQRTPYSEPAHDLSITTFDGLTLAATHFRRGRSSLIIIAHGFGSSRRSLSIVWLAEALFASFDVLTFDWRGFGESNGLASLGTAEYEDLAAVLDYARFLGYRRVGLVAESMGGLITLTTLSLANPDMLAYPDRVATISAPVDYDLTVGLRPQMVRYVAPQPVLRPLAPLLGFRLGVALPPRPLDLIDRFDLPLLVVHGDADRTVRLENAHLLDEHAPHSRLLIYSGVDHALIAMRAKVPRQLVADLQQWFVEMEYDA
jgi:pimeloyl-ACP methyl ester carboxylesterase